MRNNAGIEGKIVPFLEQTEENFDPIVAVNAKGTFLCMKAEIAQMLKNGGGTIVNLASVAGLIGFPELSRYVASKHAINGLTKTAALEYSKQGIRVNVWLCSPRAPFVTGANVPIDGGYVAQ